MTACGVVVAGKYAIATPQPCDLAYTTHRLAVSMEARDP